MLLRDHPELTPWLPDPTAVSCPGPSTPTAKEVPNLIIVNILYKSPSTINFVLSYGTGTCHLSIKFEDTAFTLALYSARDRCIGLSLQEVGEVDIT